MKNLICLILTLALLLAALCGCSKPAEGGDLSTENPAQSFPSSPMKDYATFRDFYLAESTISGILNGTQDAKKVEPCALGTETCTYKITFSDESSLFYNFRISADESYSLELLSCRKGDEPYDNFEFIPSAADGYTEAELTPLKYWELYPDIEKLESPEMLDYSDPFVGGGQLFRESGHALRLAAEVDKLEILPVERFLTDFERLMGANLSCSLSYYSSSADSTPVYTVNTDFFSVDVPGEAGKMYFVKNRSEFYDSFHETYFSLLAELRAAEAESSALAEKYGIEPCTYDEALAFAETEAALEQALFFTQWIGERTFQSGEELVTDTNFSVLWWFFDYLYNEFGSNSSAAEEFTVPKPIIDELLFKYFGVKNYDPSAAPVYDKENSSFSFSTATDHFNWVIDSIELQDVKSNTVTYKYSFHYCIFDDQPGPFRATYISFATLKTDNETFFRLISGFGLTEEFATPEEALASLN